MNEVHRQHISFLLRLWREELSSPAWRASLEDAATGERKGFANVETLAEYLQSLTEETESVGGQDEQTTRSESPSP